MSLDPTGQWGIRERIRIAVEQGYSYDGLAVVLHVPAAVLLEYMTDPVYVLAPEYVTAITEHLFDVLAPDVYYDKTTTPYGIEITYVESVWWTEDQLEGVMAPDRAAAFKVHFLSESEQHRPSSSPLYAYPDFSPADVARSVTGGDLERLLCIVFYEYADLDA